MGSLMYVRRSYGSSFGLDKQPQKTMSASASTPSDILRKSLPLKPQGQVLETVKKEPEFTFQKEVFQKYQRS